MSKGEVTRQRIVELAGLADLRGHLSQHPQEVRANGLHDLGSGAMKIFWRVTASLATLAFLDSLVRQAAYGLGYIEKAHLSVLQAACFRRKSARVNSISWHNTLTPRARLSRNLLPLWRAPSLAKTWPEAGLS